MNALTLKNGYLTYNEKTYKDCNLNEKILFNEAIKEQQQEDDRLMQMLKRATLPLLYQYRELKLKTYDTEPLFI